MLPFGYTVALILAMIPPVFMRVFDSLAVATNNNEKISDEEKKAIDKIVNVTMVFIMGIISFLCFYLS